jgi:hypothetical protein
MMPGNGSSMNDAPKHRCGAVLRSLTSPAAPSRLDAATIRVLIRVLTRCLHRNPRFRPLEQDRELLMQLLRNGRRQDLLAQLES